MPLIDHLAAVVLDFVTSLPSARVKPLPVSVTAFLFNAAFDTVTQQLQKNYDDKERLSSEALRMRMQTVYKERNDNLYNRLVTEFNAVYPNALSEFSVAHPELTDTERAICLLSFFSFRVKEIAYILDLRENTVSKARLAIKKKTGVEDLAEIVRPFIG